MSADGSFATTVSREELGALLSSARSEQDATHNALRPVGMMKTGGGDLVEIAKRFGLEQGRSLSTLHQTPIRFSFSHWEEINLRQFASAMLATDRVAKVDLDDRGEHVYFLLSRPLVFGWMMLAFGARPGGAIDPLPARAYTRIEERFIQRAAENVASVFAKTFSREDAYRPRVIAIEDPAVLYNRSKQPHRSISLDVDGFGEPGVLRVAIPLSLMNEERTEQSTRQLGPPPDELAGQLYETPVDVRVELGYAEVSLSDVAQLRVGDELRLHRCHGGGLVVNVEQSPKFRAETGKVGNQLAVRITEVIRS